MGVASARMKSSSPTSATTPRSVPAARGGNVRPRRIVRNAPAGKETTGSGPVLGRLRHEAPGDSRPQLGQPAAIAEFARLGTERRTGEGDSGSADASEPDDPRDRIRHDEREIIAPNPLAAAVVNLPRRRDRRRGGRCARFRARATGCRRPETVAVDEKNNENRRRRSRRSALLVYRRTADGDAAPIARSGAKTKHAADCRRSVDPVRDVLVVSRTRRLRRRPPACYLRRTIRGRAPKRVIAAQTGITRLASDRARPRDRQDLRPAITTSTWPPYDIDKRGPASDRTPSCRRRGIPAAKVHRVWDDVADDGDVPPRT